MHFDLQLSFDQILMKKYKFILNFFNKFYKLHFCYLRNKNNLNLKLKSCFYAFKLMKIIYCKFRIFSIVTLKCKKMSLNICYKNTMNRTLALLYFFLTQNIPNQL